MHVRWYGGPTDLPQEYLLRLDAQRYDVQRIEIYAGGQVVLASQEENADLLASEPWPTVAQANAHAEPGGTEYSRATTITAQQFADAWAWALRQPQREII